MTDTVKPGDPCEVTVTPLDGGGVNVTVRVPGYQADSYFDLSVERDPDGEWRVAIPWPDEVQTENAGEHTYRGMDVLNGLLYLGSPDVERPRLPRGGTPVVVTVRDPDFSNEHTVFDGAVEVHDIDLGRSDLGDVDEYLEWAAGHLADAQRYAVRGHPDAADLIREVVQRNAPSEITDEDDWITYELLVELIAAAGIETT